jgi:hypothetical protein
VCRVDLEGEPTFLVVAVELLIMGTVLEFG